MKYKTNRNRIFPSWDDIKTLKQPLNEGELTLAKYLDSNLPPEWEIYMQPYLNGDRPDIVLLNENVGIMVIEVKDYNPDLYSSNTRFNNINGKSRRFTDYYVNTTDGLQKIASPVVQANRYRKKIISLYVPEIGEAIDNDNKIFMVTKIGVYMHNMSTNKALELIKDSRYCKVFGKDELSDPQNITRVVPDAKFRKSKYFKKDWAKKIRPWLIPPYHSIEQGKKIVLSNEQMRHVSPSPGQHQRLRGVAGSGKSLVIAQRAANLAGEGKKVLIVTYNITLWHYLKDFISRARVGFDWGQIEFNHFHNFCKDYMLENGIPWSDRKLTESDWLETIPDIVKQMKISGMNVKNREYDAILVDEGQDYHKAWYDALCLFFSNNDEMLFVIDEKQNIYKRSNSWVDKMYGTKFRGRWRTLSRSYRMPFEIANKAIRFSDEFLPDEGPIMEATEKTMNMFQKLEWYNMKNGMNITEMLINAYKELTEGLSQHPSDIAILVPTHEVGIKIVGLFEHRLSVESNHIFEKDGKMSFTNKKSFYMGDSRLKVCTIHSFKGWESKNLIIFIPNQKNDVQKLDKLVYTSITRTLQNIIVMNYNERYIEFGNSWN